MKIRFFLSLICLITAISCSRNQKLIIEGKVTDPAMNGSTVYVVGPDGTGVKNEDSAVIRNGRFRFSLSADTMAIRTLSIPVHGQLAAEELIFVKEPGTLEVVMSEKSSSKGTRLSDVIMEWKRNNFVYDSTQNELYYQSGIPGISQYRRDSLLTISAGIDSAYKSRIIETLNANIGNGVGLLLFKMYYDQLPLDTRKKILDLAGEEYMKRDLQVWSKVMFDQGIPKGSVK